MSDIVPSRHKECAGLFKSLLATYRKAEDLINIGAYVTGSNPRIDQAVGMIDNITRYLQQGIEDTTSFELSVQQLEGLFQS